MSTIGTETRGVYKSQSPTVLISSAAYMPIYIKLQKGNINEAQKYISRLLIVC